jgi:hypothetical protein
VSILARFAPVLNAAQISRFLFMLRQGKYRTLSVDIELAKAAANSYSVGMLLQRVLVSFAHRQRRV